MTRARLRAHGYRVWNRRFHNAINVMAHSRIMADTNHKNVGPLKLF